MFGLLKLCDVVGQFDPGLAVPLRLRVELVELVERCGELLAEPPCLAGRRLGGRRRRRRRRGTGARAAGEGERPGRYQVTEQDDQGHPEGDRPRGGTDRPQAQQPRAGERQRATAECDLE